MKLNKLLKRIVASFTTTLNAQNATVDHLTSVGVEVDGRNVVEAGKEEFIAFRDALAAQYYEDVDCTKDNAAKVAREFLSECGYRERVKPSRKKQKPTVWRRAVMKSVKYAVKGDEIKIGDVVYKRS